MRIKPFHANIIGFHSMFDGFLMEYQHIWDIMNGIHRYISDACVCLYIYIDNIHIHIYIWDTTKITYCMGYHTVISAISPTYHRSSFKNARMDDLDPESTAPCRLDLHVGWFNSKHGEIALSVD